MVVTKKFLKSSNVPDIESIAISYELYINGSKNLIEEKIYNIMFPKVLSLLQQEFKSCHDKLSHLHSKSMFSLAKFGVLPSRSLDLKYDVPLCVSCMLGTTRRGK